MKCSCVPEVGGHDCTQLPTIAGPNVTVIPHERQRIYENDKRGSLISYTNEANQS